MVERDDFRRLEEMMNRMLEEVWGRPRRWLLPSGEKGEIAPSGYTQPFIDVIDRETELIAAAEMPGLDKKDIKINLTDDRLEISAEKKHEEEKEEKGYVFRERSSGSYYRAISLPSTIDPEKATASYKNGVLEIKMPKSEIKQKKSVKVE